MIRKSDKSIENELTDKISEVLSKALNTPVKYDSWICHYKGPAFFEAQYFNLIFFKFRCGWKPIAQIYKKDPLELTTEQDNIAKILDKAGYNVIMDQQEYGYVSPPPDACDF